MSATLWRKLCAGYCGTRISPTCFPASFRKARVPAWYYSGLHRFRTFRTYMNTTTNSLVQKLWNDCNVLRLRP